MLISCLISQSFHYLIIFGISLFVKELSIISIFLLVPDNAQHTCLHICDYTAWFCGYPPIFFSRKAHLVKSKRTPGISLKQAHNNKKKVWLLGISDVGYERPDIFYYTAQSLAEFLQ